MAPSALEPRRRNEVIITREEAMKRRVRKGYAFEPVPVDPAADLNKGLKKLDDVDSRRRRSTGSSFSAIKSSAEAPPVADFPAAAVPGGDQPSLSEGCGVSHKRKATASDGEAHRVHGVHGVDDAMAEGRIGSRENSRDGGKSPGSAGWTRGERRGLRRKFRDELEQLQGLCQKVDAREGALRREELAGRGAESRKRMKRTENGTVAAHVVDGGSIEESPVAVAAAGPLVLPPEVQVKGLETEPSGKDRHTPRPGSSLLSADSFHAKEKVSAPEKGKGKKVPGKLPELDVRRQRIVAARARRLGDIFKQCATLLKRLMSHKYGWVFKEPVDAAKLGLHDYHTVITKPMDLGTISARIKASGYQHPDELYSDVQLVWANAMRYNGEGSDVYIMAVELKGLFEQGYRKIRLKVEEDTAKRRQEEQELVAAAEEVKETKVNRTVSEGREKPEVLELEKRLQKLESQLQVGGQAMGKAAAQAQAKGKLPQRDMTFAEKQKLSVNLGKLPPENLDRIVQIISERNPDLSQNADEIELDIDSLDSETLWELERYVSNCMKSKSKRKKIPLYDTVQPKVPDALPAASQQEPKEGDDSVDIVEAGPLHGAGAASAADSAAPKLPAGNGVGGRGSPGTSGSSSSSDESSSSDSDSDSDSSASESDQDRRSEPARGKQSQSRDSAKASEGKCTSPNAGGDSAAASEGAKMEVDRKQIEKPKEVKPSPKGDDEAAVKAALLRGKYADIILNAQKKATETQAVDQKQLEEIERKHKEERARLEAEARAAQESRRRKEAEAAMEARKKLEEQREAMRRALQGMAKSVELDESHAIMKDMHLLSAPAEHIGVGPGRSTDLPFGGDGARVPGLGPQQGMNVLEHLGLSLRDDESDGEESESEKEADGNNEEVEDGEI
ncbi:hypothetical protein CLOM_g15055 [Closterium sp. NIES-68]|nr:hypothetical protein CLOM_g22442 [Closterium sp. NIES-68]GJP56005.1 hypothetical protein CLOM_g15055 [Closterium sp. NIES-68]GJP70213.1 hypothetical protein CLOP_g1179 [Closterium sp. NIES-67]